MGIAHLLWADLCSYHLDIRVNDILSGSPREPKLHWPLQLIEHSLRGVRLRQVLMTDGMGCSCNLTGLDLACLQMESCCVQQLFCKRQSFLPGLQKLQGHLMYLPVLDRFLWFFFKSGFSFIYAAQVNQEMFDYLNPLAFSEWFHTKGELILEVVVFARFC